MRVKFLAEKCDHLLNNESFYLTMRVKFLAQRKIELLLNNEFIVEKSELLLINEGKVSC